MTLVARILRTSIALVALTALAGLSGPAAAGNRAVPAGCEDASAKARGNSTPESAANASRRESTSLSPSPTDDCYVPLSRSAPPVVAPAPTRAQVEAAAPSPATPRSEKPAIARKVPAPPAAPGRARPQAPGRAKVSVPNLPAQPGMGTLLRVGITAGREIS